jgi:hypothetical protein
MHRAIAIVLTLGLSIYSSLASGRYIESDPIGIMPAHGLPMAPIPGASPPGRMLTSVRAMTSTDVLRSHALNHSYGYVDAKPLSFIDPYGLWGCPSNMRAVPIPGSEHLFPKQANCVLDPQSQNKKVCITAECAAGTGSVPSDFRTQAEVDRGGCELVCGMVGPGGPIPLSLSGVGKIIGWGYACQWYCKDPNRNPLCRPSWGE